MFPYITDHAIARAQKRWVEEDPTVVDDPTPAILRVVRWGNSRPCPSGAIRYELEIKRGLRWSATVIDACVITVGVREDTYGD